MCNNLFEENHFPQDGKSTEGVLISKAAEQEYNLQVHMHYEDFGENLRTTFKKRTTEEREKRACFQNINLVSMKRSDNSRRSYWRNIGRKKRVVCHNNDRR